MQFNSLEFALFVAIVVPLAWALKGRPRHLLLLAASYTFYASWDWRFLSLIVASTFIDFQVGKRLEAENPDRIRKRLLLVSLGANLAILGFFKYFGFFVESFTRMLTDLGVTASPTLLHIALPVGVSFYTFQTMAYSIDVFHRKRLAERDPVVFALFVAYFPQLVAGPIERSERLLPQLKEAHGRPNGVSIASGLGLIVEGLFRKVVIADLAAPIANKAFDGGPEIGIAATAAGVLAFALQIYGDFSGYTAIARGTSRLVGIELSRNFREPYLSRSITEFWRRWHITLSNWLRDYLYIPLGGNRGGSAATARNLALTMLLGGLWHGAAWTFVFWGGLQGVYLAIERGGWRPGADVDGPLRFGQIPLMLVTFGQTLLAWVFFRAADFGEAFDVLRSLVSGSIGPIDEGDLLIVPLTLLTLALDLARRHITFPQAVQKVPVGSGVALGLATVSIVVAAGADPTPFIYFQF